MLYLVATPIGNLADITFRAIEILKSCDYILCEDTRHSGILLKHYNISKPLKSHHKFNENQQDQSILEDLQEGRIIAMISDAGTPGISDPGSKLVESCRSRQIPVFAIPGPCAAIAALTSSGLATERFQFIGFLPRKTGELKKVLQEATMYPGTSICYEASNRLGNVLKLLNEVSPERKIVVARELTKKFEEVCQGTPQTLLQRHQDNPFRGEIVLMIAGQVKENLINWESLSPEEHVNFIQENYALSRKDAIKMAAELRGIPKRLIYNALIKNEFNEN